MADAYHVLADKISGTKPPAAWWTPPAKQRQQELMAKIQSTADILEKMGHCPVTRLANLTSSPELNDFQRASLEKWLMEYSQEKPKTSQDINVDGDIKITEVVRKIVDA